MSMTDRQCPACGAYVASDRLTDRACWDRVPMDLKHALWSGRRKGIFSRDHLLSGGEILRWLRENPPKSTAKK
jgi:hypothetical protein